jgi:acetyl-CoA acetyltransferase family protein
MPKAVVVGATRTAVGTARRGTLTETPAEVLAEHVVREVIARSGLPGERFDDIYLGDVMYGGGDLGRYAADAIGLETVPGISVNRHCASSLTTTGLAAASIRSGMESAIIAGGVQASSLNPITSFRKPHTEADYEQRMTPTFKHRDDLDEDVMLTVGWNLAQKFNLSREQLDAWAYRSHQRAVAAIDAGRFVDEITPITVVNKAGETVEFKVDEHPRRDTTMEKLASLKPLHPEIEGFSITAGNAAGGNDAGSALALASDELAAAEGLDVLAEVVAWGSAGVDPRYTGTGALAAADLVLKRAGLGIKDIALWEINEAFATVPVVACQEMGIDEELVNIYGSGCSIGHPVAASGGRMLNTLIYELRRRGGGYGLATMCAGGGQGGAVLIRV